MICKTCGLNAITLSKFIDVAEKEKEELTELRAWKEKARPFLEKFNYILPKQLEQVDKGNQKRIRGEMQTLTELLGGEK